MKTLSSETLLPTKIPFIFLTMYDTTRGLKHISIEVELIVNRPLLSLIKMCTHINFKDCECDILGLHVLLKLVLNDSYTRHFS